MKHDIEKLAHTIDEAVYASGLGRTKIYEEIKSKRLLTKNVGRRTLITNLREYLTGRVQ